jgi:hypothetical protein
MTKGRFDFEQDIFNCWHIIDDIKQLYEMVSNRNTSIDDIANVLLGLQTLYQDRFDQLMTSFEQLIVTTNTDASIATDKYEKMYDELLAKLRVISETEDLPFRPAERRITEDDGKETGWR